MNRRKGMTLIELMIVVSIVGVVASIAVPNLLRARMVANESACVANLRTIKTQQLVFQLQAEVDQDGDGTGEAGLICELAGEITPRNEEAKGAASPVFIAPSFATQGANGTAMAERSGYLYRMFLADGDVTAGNDQTLGGTGNEEGEGGVVLDPSDPVGMFAINVQEKHFVCYAWPLEHKGTGRRAFVVNATTETHATVMNAVVYTGAISTIEDYAAAYWDDGSGDTWFNNCILAGRIASDGNIWVKTGG